MNRRNFLSMALGAVLAIPLLKKPAVPNEKAIEKINSDLQWLGLEYFNGTNDERKIIIEELSALISKMRRKNARELMENYRDWLVTLPMASEVLR